MNDKFALKALAKGDFKENILYKALLFKGEAQKQLFKLSRDKRRECFPSMKIEVRSVIEIANICQRKCNFCNISFYSRSNKRYLLQYNDIIETVECLYSKGRKVILFQSGENKSQKYIDFVCKCVRSIKKRFQDLTIILCLGNLSSNQYRQLRLSGADRYILKFETSNPELYRQIKPDDSLAKRIKSIEVLNKLGFEVGSGNMIGLPRQTLANIVNDLLFIHNFNLTMVSTSIFIPGENSNYRDEPKGNFNIALNYMALMRILYPKMLIPSTSSLEKARRNGQYLGLMAGANSVTIHDGTPNELKKYYPIYSTKRFVPNERQIRKIVLKAGLF